MLEKKTGTVLESALHSALSYEKKSKYRLIFLMRREKQTKKLFPTVLEKKKKKEKINKNMKIVIFSKNISKIKTFLRKDLRIQYYVCYANFIRISL